MKNIKIITIVISFLVLSGVIGFILYNKNINNQELHVSKEYNIAYIGAHLFSPYWIKLGNSFKNESINRGVILHDYTPNNDIPEERMRAAEELMLEDFDAVILGIGGEKELSENVINKFKRKNIPVFLVDAKFENPDIQGYVGLSNYESSKILGEYIYSETNGLGDCLMIYPNNEHQNAVERKDGIVDSLQPKGVRVVVKNLNDTTWSLQPVYELISEEFGKENEYTSIATAWDEATLTVINVAKKNGGDENLIYTGFDGLDRAFESINSGEMSATMIQPTANMAKESLIQVIHYLEGEDYEKEVLVPGILVTRENVDKYLNTD
ncbi:MAG: sugar ABC transporter substrate-binding protein [Nanoarchaeota archaeon]|jgi:ABC-type sugar transport system substrate-binding protein|nr:sugar ABC transporter substrate-binding protein [Nanoarchaeota archaeon]